MASSGNTSGRQFDINPITGQVFYCEPVDGYYSSWTALEPSDYHPPRPASHNVSRVLRIHLLCTDLSCFSHRYSLPVHTTLLGGLKRSLPTRRHRYLLAPKSGRICKPLVGLCVPTIPSAANHPLADHMRGERGGLGVLQITAPERSKSSLTMWRPNSLLARRGGTRLAQGSVSGQPSPSVLLGPTAHWRQNSNR